MLNKISYFIFIFVLKNLSHSEKETLKDYSKIPRHRIYFLIRKVYGGGGGRFHGTHINTSRDVNNSTI